MAVCDCGNTKEVLARKVASGAVASCGMCEKGLGIQTPHSRNKQGIPKGHRAHFSNLLRKYPDAHITTGDYTRLLGGRCVACNTRDIHVEWSGIPGAMSSTDLITICRVCSSERRGRNVLKWLEYICRVAQSVIARRDLQNRDVAD